MQLSPRFPAARADAEVCPHGAGSESRFPHSKSVKTRSFPELGFVFSNTDIEAFIRRRDPLHHTYPDDWILVI